MKFSDFSDREAQALVTYYTQLLTVKAQEDQSYNQAGVRLLLLANGAGIALLGTFVGGLAQAQTPLTPFILPLICFLTGLITGGLLYLPLMAVSSNAITVMGQNIELFITNKKNIEELQYYGFNRRGRIIMLSIALISMGSFVAGVWQSVSALIQLS